MEQKDQYVPLGPTSWALPRADSATATYGDGGPVGTLSVLTRDNVKSGYTAQHHLSSMETGQYDMSPQGYRNSLHPQVAPVEPVRSRFELIVTSDPGAQTPMENRGTQRIAG